MIDLSRSSTFGPDLTGIDCGLTAIINAFVIFLFFHLRGHFDEWRPAAPVLGIRVHVPAGPGEGILVTFAGREGI